MTYAVRCRGVHCLRMSKYSSMQSELIITQLYACASYGLLSFQIRPQMVVAPSLVNLQSVLEGGPLPPSLCTRGRGCVYRCGTASRTAPSRRVSESDR